MYSVKSVAKEASKFLKELFLFDIPTKIEYISKLNLDSEKHLEILVHLSEFLMLNGVNSAQDKVIRTPAFDTDAMLRDTPLTVGYTDNMIQSRLEEQNVQKRDSQQSSIIPNVQLQDNLVLLDISQKDKLKLLGEFLIKEIEADYNDDALNNFLEKNKGYKSRLKFIGEFILSKNFTEKNEYKGMCSEKAYKKC
ncbi:hypothetical protein NBO_2g0080 [Nosema bombycis CQ1]|uniref:Uncharacterized protein n=1 Tax=Nosema bombycis (strain CQ1 / CVCC 102059) TaxID=578461 RepID=R0MC89_NOSB1|nr:hypothetical protein NBO_2g0080 [Nosema bombycis CQ1]|eukprot:EOB15589.1 hypothetical protein NBO_2g0080 [Nosema bombycis CQ1]